MKILAQIVSYLALAATILPAILFLSGSATLAQAKTWMIVATVVWFVTVPIWMGRKPV